MIQDISPHILKNEYQNESAPTSNDLIMLFWQDKILASSTTLTIQYPNFETLVSGNISSQYTYRYLFKVDEQNFYLAIPKQQAELSSQHPQQFPKLPGYSYITTRTFRTAEPMEMAYAGVTAYHLYQWYRDNQYCGRCGEKLEHSHTERMLSCPKCKNMIYPRISPSVIVGVTNKDKILITRYAAGRGYRKYALVAGFTEIGETAEQTVAREVMEETGIRVKNIRYYKSQPWGFSGGLLLGYWAELDGEDTIHLDESELCEGKWVTRDELELDSSLISLTREMMKCFKEGKE